ncbi:P-loop containing nucleoside triphosphate hydrolase protein [Collybia nuda]|uniref:P-loop containing nucleoside triphosphate hydrolase protein n=1 Tax=Collybia nuda TaxID=64659 RepID=A0A9P6CKE2_9AGAR|nr:P-loop containing nucleoside triphosphate hydrolase protein [Collybia nuda]
MDRPASPSNDMQKIRKPFRHYFMPKEAYIAVMGATGSGKSTFINCATGSDSEKVSDELASCTREIKEATPFKLNGYKVRLIDTPGFDDTERSEVEILRKISDYLGQQYKSKRRLRGVIYLHRISDNRMGGIARRTFEIMQNLCDVEEYSKGKADHLAIVTNMWSLPYTGTELQREAQLKTDHRFFAPAIGAGAKYFKHENTTLSAHDIIMNLLPTKRVVLDIQRELVVDKKSFPNTKVGQVAKRHVEEDLRKFQKGMETVSADITKAKEQGDVDVVEELQDELTEYKKTISRLLSDHQGLRTDSNVQVKSRA